MTDQPPRPDADKPDIDPSTQSVLDSLDDELDEEVSQDEGTKQILQALDELKPQTVEPVEGGGADETTTSADSTTSSAGATPSEDGSEKPVEDVADVPTVSPTEPAPPPKIKYRYRVTISPPPEIQQQISAAIEAIELDRDVMQDAMQWQAEFTTLSEETVIDTITRWVKNSLPLSTSLSRVYADVFGAQDYVAGWHLADEQKLQDAHRQLTMQLAPLITIEPTANTVFRTFYALSFKVPAMAFPKLVAHLQNNFSELEWKMNSCELRRQALGEDDKPLPDAVWEVAKVFQGDN